MPSAKNYVPKDQADFYRPELDGLRFFAFVSVYLTHTVGYGAGSGAHHHLPNWVGDLLQTVGEAGVFGVDLFFALSSYLITSLLLRELSIEGKLDIRRFYIRRILRIWPVYFLVTIIAWIASFWVSREQFPLGALFSFLFFIGNWPFVFFSITTIAAPLWSVAVEEQFYLIWPWLIRRGGLRAIEYSSFFILIMGAIGCGIAQILTPNLDWVTKNSFTRIDGIAIGALIAIFSQKRNIDFRVALRPVVAVLSVVSLLLIAYEFHLFYRPISTLAVIFGWLGVSLACGGILVSVIGCSGKMRIVFANPVMVYLGRISYGLYAYHEIAIRIGDDVFPGYSSSLLFFTEHWFFSLALSLLIASASFRWLEAPFIRLKQRRFTVVASRID